MLQSNKRNAMGFESPEVTTCKRRRMLGAGRPNSPSPWAAAMDGGPAAVASPHQQGPFFFGPKDGSNDSLAATNGGGLFGGGSATEGAAFGNASAAASPAARPSPHGANKRRRGDVFEHGQSDLELLRSELERMRHKFQEQELVNQNLNQACENQQRELKRLHQENRLLKNSVLKLNERRERAEHGLGRAQNELSAAHRRVRELEEANVRLCFQAQQHSIHTCRNDDFHDHNPFSGGGPVC